MSTSLPPWPVKSYTSPYKAWPYFDADFTRQDGSPDSAFYSGPRFVTHIDDGAIKALRAYYEATLPRQGRLLDFCSSWISHYPPSVEAAAEQGALRITGMGMNRAELEANDVLNAGRLVVDLNDARKGAVDLVKTLSDAGAIGAADSEKLDAATNVVSIDYLTQPVAVLRSLLDATKVGGSVHLAISNRCFPTKVIRRWRYADEQERLELVGDFLHFAGWKQIELVNLCGDVPQSGAATEANSSGVQPDTSPSARLGSFLSSMGMHTSRDPLWVVRAIKQ